MKGYISSWKFGDDSVTSCPGDVFPFDVDGVSDSELASFLQQSGPFRDSGPCDGNVPVQFATQGGFAVNIRRAQQQVTFHELAAATPERQPLRAVNRMAFSAAKLQLDKEAPLAGHVSAGLQIQHPKGSKKLDSVLHVEVQKPKDARVVLTVHHDASVKTMTFPFGKSVRGTQKVTLSMKPQEELSGVHHVFVQGVVQRKDSDAKVQVNLKHIEVKSR